MIKSKKKVFFKNENRAQAAAELAIFGAILIFVIGLIARTGLSIGTSMNSSLRVFRYALSESYRTSERQYSCAPSGSPCHDSAARNSATILILEDRLSVNSGQKMGSRDRIPYIAFSSATMNHNLFLPVEDNETWSMPIYDMIINGQRFPFRISSTSNFILDNSLPLCPIWPSALAGDSRCWEPFCVKSTDGSTIEGCPVIYRIISRNDSPAEWCTETGGVPCAANMTADERFDLDLDGTTDITAVELDVTWLNFFRDTFSWQWIKVPVVPGFREGDIVLGATPADCAVPGCPLWLGFPALPIPAEIALLSNPRGYETLAAGMNADVDGDYRDESVSDLAYLPVPPPIVARIKVLYRNRGEIDLSGQDGGVSGLKTDDMQMFSFVRDPGNSSPLGQGTYLRIEEGQLFGAGSGQFIRTTTRQDSVDVVQRRIVLRSTGDCNFAGPVDRFCTISTDASDDPACMVTGRRDWLAAPNWSADNALSGLDNPVEVCVPPPIGSAPHECFMPINMYRTCLQWGDAATNPVIFVRSRIQDLRGRRWITRVE